MDPTHTHAHIQFTIIAICLSKWTEIKSNDHSDRWYAYEVEAPDYTDIYVYMYGIHSLHTLNLAIVPFSYAVGIF